jgi:CheY-like chemotaxis protein
VTDTGAGIPPDHVGRIFEPFFTTKEPGSGTGLGLSTVMGIVKGHDGFVSVYSEPGRGTRFVVGFPAAEGGPKSALRLAAAPAAGAGELVLVVDDESAIAKLTRQTLEASGYRVLTAGHGAEAVELFERHAADVRVLLTDLMMPVMDGPATIRALRRRRPDLRVIAMSGLADTSGSAAAVDAGADAMLRKPYTAVSLLETLRDVLRRP